jgi:hypothetical protein
MNNKYMVEKLESSLDDIDQMEIVRLMNRLVFFQREEMEMAEKIRTIAIFSKEVWRRNSDILHAACLRPPEIF